MLPQELVRFRIHAADLLHRYTKNHEDARRNLLTALHLLNGQTSSIKFNSLRAAIHLRLAESHARIEQNFDSSWVCMRNLCIYILFLAN